MRSPVRIWVAAPNNPEVLKTLGALAFYTAVCTPYLTERGCLELLPTLCTRYLPWQIPVRISALLADTRSRGIAKGEISSPLVNTWVNNPKARKTLGALHLASTAVCNGETLFCLRLLTECSRCNLHSLACERVHRLASFDYVLFIGLSAPAI